MRVHRVQAPIRHQIAENLRNAIIVGELKPGDRLVERELCEMMQVSRTSLREALRQLEAEGLVKALPHRGSIVAPVTVEEAQEIYEVRRMLEALACKLFAERASKAELSAMRRAILNIGKATQRGSTRELLRANNEFYDVILEGCGNTLIQGFIRSLHARITLLRYTSLSQPGRAVQSLSEIKEISAAIDRGDPDGAWKTCVEHLQNAEKVALGVLPSLEVNPA